MALQVACERLVDESDLGCDCDLPADQDVIDNVLDAASDFLSMLADTSLGRCTAEYRPCRDRCLPCNLCRCCRLLGIHLPGHDPTVSKVLIDGVVVDPATYVVIINPIGQYVLERINAEGNSISWPTCQKIVRASTQPNTFEITVESGYPRNQLMTLAAAEIACDIFAYMAGAEHMLPAGVASAAAYGIVMNARLPFDPTRSDSPDLSQLIWTTRFLQSIPETTGTQILSPEILDGWMLYSGA